MFSIKKDEITLAYPSFIYDGKIVSWKLIYPWIWSILKDFNYYLMNDNIRYHEFLTIARLTIIIFLNTNSSADYLYPLKSLIVSRHLFELFVWNFKIKLQIGNLQNLPLIHTILKNFSPSLYTIIINNDFQYYYLEYIKDTIKLITSNIPKLKLIDNHNLVKRVVTLELGNIIQIPYNIHEERKSSNYIPDIIDLLEYN